LNATQYLASSAVGFRFLGAISGEDDSTRVNPENLASGSHSRLIRSCHHPISLLHPKGQMAGGGGV
jgi:hypothetical protein